MQIVTLTTDYGYTDYYVAALKGSVLSNNPSVQLVDISHNIETYDIIQGAYFVSRSINSFPEKTIHVIAISNYLEGKANLIAVEKQGQYFIGPDNGIFSLIFEDLQAQDCFEVSVPENQGGDMHSLIAHAVAYLSHGLAIQEIGPVAENIVRKLILRPVVTSSQIRATIIHVDHYGNVITNLDKATFEKARKERPYAIYYKNRDPIRTLTKHYGQAAIGDVLCRFNGGGNLEIAINSGNAHKLLGLRKNETIQIDFEE
jgi:S-adenosylmethionine hydrolase